MKLFSKLKNKKKELLNNEIDNSKNDSLQLIYTDKLNNEYYTFKEFLKMPALRAIAGERATRFQEMNITKELLKLSIKKIKEFLNKGKMADAAGIVSELEIRLAMFGEEETVLEIAYCYILLKDENINYIDSDILKRKKELVLKDYELRNFFLSTALRFIKKYSDTSDGDFLTYLKEITMIGNRLSSYLTEKH